MPRSHKKKVPPAKAREEYEEQEEYVPEDILPPAEARGEEYYAEVQQGPSWQQQVQEARQALQPSWAPYVNHPEAMDTRRVRIRSTRHRVDDQVCHHCNQRGHIHPRCPNRDMSRTRARPWSPLITPISRPRQRSVSPNEDPDYVAACCHWEGMPRPPLRHQTSNEEVNAAFRS